MAVALPPAPARRARVLVFMSYTTDYRLGYVCEAINRAWAERHGYGFLSEVLDPSAMQAAIQYRAHATWHKVVMINRLLAELAQSGHISGSATGEAAAGEDLEKIRRRGRWAGRPRQVLRRRRTQLLVADRSVHPAAHAA